MRATYRVEGMHCDGCAAKIATALEAIDAVRDASVSFPSRSATVELDRPLELEQLNAAVRQQGSYRILSGETPQPGGAPREASDSSPRSQTPQAPESSESLYPLALIVGYILGTVLLIALATGGWAPEAMMRHFMAGFFLVFSFFKLLNLRGFVDAYREYDLLAMSWPAWAWAYPFVELALGIAYLVAFVPLLTNSVTLVVMTLGAVGVLQALRHRRRLRCACLGTALNLPMTKVTLVEDVTMAAMAAAMLIMIWT